MPALTAFAGHLRNMALNRSQSSKESKGKKDIDLDCYGLTPFAKNRVRYILGSKLSCRPLLLLPLRQNITYGYRPIPDSASSTDLLERGAAKQRNMIGTGENFGRITWDNFSM